MLQGLDNQLGVVVLLTWSLLDSSFCDEEYDSYDQTFHGRYEWEFCQGSLGSSCFCYEEYGPFD